MKARPVLAWLLLLAPAFAHTTDIEVDHIRVLTGSTGTFLELQLSYPLEPPLELRVVRTDRGKGVFEKRSADGWVPVPTVPIPRGVSNFGLHTSYRIRLVGGEYHPGETVPVTLLFPAGALVTLPAPVETIEEPPYTLFLILLTILTAGTWLLSRAIRKRRGSPPAARAR